MGSGNGVGAGHGSGVGPGRGYGIGAGSASGVAGGVSGGVAGGVPGGVAGPPTSGPGSNGPPAQPKPAESPAVRDKVERLSPEDMKRREILSKLHPALSAVAERLAKKVTQPGPQEAKFVRNGKAEVQIWLIDTSKETLELLKQLGFEIILEPKTTKMVIGRLPIEKLEALAKLTQVRYVSPMTTSN